jgi:hypothetical protein
MNRQKCFNYVGSRNTIRAVYLQQIRTQLEKQNMPILCDENARLLGGGFKQA